MKPITHEVAGESLVLLPEKCIYWTKEKCLVISDIHFGKVDHFRKNGFAIPSKVGQANFILLKSIIDRLQPSSIIFLGDLFHSEINQDWKNFTLFVETFKNINFTLIKGNHDIIHNSLLHSVLDSVLSSGLKKGPFFLTHEPEHHKSLYNLCGHIHPNYIAKKTGFTSIRLPCFFFGRNQGILPAFGAFTGGYTLQQHQENEYVYVIADQEVIPLSYI